jgi:DNA-binding NarL/FixJ family response regulator
MIEDDRVTRKMIERLLEKNADCELVGAWATGEEALAEVKRIQPDVVLVDLELPGITGEDCLSALSVMLPCSALVVLTVHDHPERVFPALRAGANGYLLKGASAAELVAGMKAAFAGGCPLSPAIAGLVIQAFKKQPAAPAKPVIPLPSLAPRERQILEHLAKGMAPKEVASELFISYETVRDHLKNIYQKLHVRSRTEAVLRYLESGQESKP